MPEPQTETNQGKIDVELVQCLVIIAPDWFARDDFLDWRQGKRLEQWAGPACWNPKDRDGEYADVFVVFDRGWADDVPVEPGTEHFWEGSDQEGLPDDIYMDIGRLLHEHDVRLGVVWIKPA